MILMPQIFYVIANENVRYKRNELELASLKGVAAEVKETHELIYSLGGGGSGKCARLERSKRNSVGRYDHQGSSFVIWEDCDSAL